MILGTWDNLLEGTRIKDLTIEHRGEGTITKIYKPAYYEIKFDSGLMCTYGMPDSVEIITIPQTTMSRISKIEQQVVVNVKEEWRKWRNDQPGECPCGINRQQCTYHKE